MILPYGAMVNAIGIVLGGCLGMALGSHLPERIRLIVFQGLGLCVTVIGLKMALITEQPIIVIFSILLGSILGEALKLETYLIRLGDSLKRRFRSTNPQFTDGMVNASVMFCIGAMAILGSFDEGLRGDRTIVFSKSLLDSFAAMAMASAYGFGVLFSAIPVLIYQGALTMFAGGLQPWLPEAAMNELTAVGGTLIIGIGLNLLDLTRIPLSNMLPSLGIVIALTAIFVS